MRGIFGMRSVGSPVVVVLGVVAIGAPSAMAQSGGERAAREPVRVEDREALIEAVEEVIARMEASGDHGIRLPAPVTDADFPARNEAKELLGRLLFFDKVLSGNMNISCATCHHPLAGTGDGLSLSVGEGAMGLGMTRDTGTGAAAVHERVPRNAPHLFNIGAAEFTRMFHDGRVEVDPSAPSGFRTPAGALLPQTLEGVLAAQAMFPVTSATEMAGQASENPIGAMAEAGDLPGVWEALAERLRGIPEYVALFEDAFDDVDAAADITFAHAANAIAAWEAGAFRADRSPFDRFLRGDRSALSASEKKGMQLFYGRAGCSDCHSGALQTSHEFRGAAMPQIGPGKGDNLPGYSDGHDDFGRARVTGNAAHRFQFRVPTLRNVAVTGPWGHDGAYDTLESAVRHMLDPLGELQAYDPSQAALPPRPDLDALDFVAHNDATRRDAIADACEAPAVSLKAGQFEQLMDFLHALTDPGSLDMRREIPTSVPSGLPVFD
jgi:cytochrome c peroxidase